jgi:diguanylate cyclase (GGDEF)-like protein/PAS domain S-box-containing protein
MAAAADSLNWKSSITWKFFLYALAGLLAVAILVSAAYGWFLYRQGKNHLDENLSQIEDIYIPRLVYGLWITDYESIGSQIEGIVNLNYIEGIEIRDEETERTFSAGMMDAAGLEVLSWDLVYTYKNEQRNIGSMSLYINGTAIIGDALKAALWFFILQALLSLLLAGVIAGAFHMAIGRHLFRLALFLRDDDPVSNNHPFVLQWSGQRKDELAMVVDCFNEMRRRIARDVGEIRQWRDLMEYIIRYDPNAIAVHDTDMKYLFVSDRYVKDYGLEGQDVIGRSHYDLFPATTESWKTIHKRTLSGEVLGNEEDLLVREDGRVEYVRWQYRPWYRRDGSIGGIVRYTENITERKVMERNLFLEKEKFRTTLFSVGDGVISTDEKGHVVLMNAVAAELTGWTQEEAAGRPLEEVFHVISEKTRKEAVNPAEVVLQQCGKVKMEDHALLISRSGKEIPVEDSAAPISDAEGSTRGVVLVFRDASEKRERQREIEYLSYHDQLTGLYNRWFLGGEQNRLDVSRNLPLSLAMIDVNGLKLVNDAFGHKTGDALLRKVAEVLKRECRADDIIGRIGGDEFVILLPGLGPEEVGTLMERIAGAMERETVGDIPLSVSFGWATKTSPEQDADKLFEQAEDNMYRNKISERSNYQYKVVQLILKALYEKSPGEEGHSLRVSRLCGVIGKAMGLNPAEIKELEMAGTVHDIGKVVISSEILNKNKPLEESDWAEIRKHPEAGYSILSTLNRYSPLADIVLMHHERWDGSGYPKGLEGENIPLFARIVSVAEAFDAMRQRAESRKSFCFEEVLGELERNAGTQFDPVIVEVLVEEIFRSTDHPMRLE